MPRRLGARARVATGEEREAEIVVGDEVVAGDRERVSVERDVGAPVRQLLQRQRAASHHGRRREAGDDGGRPRRCGVGDRGCRPCEREEDADQRHVGVTVGGRLHADLHEPDHGQRAHDEPRPADEDEGRAPRIPDGDGRDGGEHGGGDGDLAGIEAMRVRIENGETARPERPAQVRHVGDEGVAGAERDRDGIDAGDVLAAMLRGHRDDDGRRRDGGERELLDDERLPPPPAPAARKPFDAAKRPPVEEQQQDR